MIDRLFSMATPIWRGVSVAGDLILLNLFLIATIAPVVTAGAGFTAVYDTVRRMLDGTEGRIAQTFWRSFRANLAGATAIWAVLLPAGAAIALAWIFLDPPELRVIEALISLVYLLVFPFAWAMQARFENSPMRTLRNAVLVAVGRLPFALGALAAHLVLLAIGAATLAWMPQVLLPLILLGYPLAAYASTPLLERAIRPLMR
ncbi:YesL family protein [Microbacterium halophytorum]|uniref:YesL family protein n=1 Tax=Microbacterium halophytorum TaxID=2067568 RepID=UPI000CFB4CAB|nr:YesL family protein [Microbacterium halophytorum]